LRGEDIATADWIRSELRSRGERLGEWDLSEQSEPYGEHRVLVFAFRRLDEPDAPRRKLVAKQSSGFGRATAERIGPLVEALDELPRPELGIPRPILHGADWLVSDYAPGAPMARFTSESGRTDAFRRAGCALARLHCLDRHGLPVRKLDDHLADRVRPHPDELGRALPERAELVARALSWLREVEHAEPSLSPVPIHRDFHLRQLFDTPERVWVVDWDELAAGDPAFDVAGFVTYLRTHRVPDRQIREAAFLAGYAEIAPLPAAGRMHLYTAFHLLRRACRRFRLGDAGWREELEWMLNMLSGLIAQQPREIG